ncbi:MAG: hypothetical protein HQL12_09620 [Candidatus Omnitrophica bacterium]|nr:hypothetical protein [Candidatus Omnitrophota bacterium]
MGESETNPFLDTDSFKKLKASQRGVELLKIALKKSLIKLKENYTTDEIKKLLGVDRMTVYRWAKTGNINACYTKLVERLQNDIAIGENPEGHIMKTEEALRQLKEHKEVCGSWDKLAEKINVERKTIWRWLKTGKISQGYLRALYYFFNESVGE